MLLALPVPVIDVLGAAGSFAWLYRAHVSPFLRYWLPVAQAADCSPPEQMQDTWLDGAKPCASCSDNAL